MDVALFRKCTGYGVWLAQEAGRGEEVSSGKSVGYCAMLLRLLLEPPMPFSVFWKLRTALGT